MEPIKVIDGFSRLGKEEKRRLVASFFSGSEVVTGEFSSFDHPSKQAIIDQFSENTIANYVLPYGIAPNFLVNGELYHVPMVIEESSVVAAASAAAKFWLTRGGFQARVMGMVKTGHVHFSWSGPPEVILSHWKGLREFMKSRVAPYTTSMVERGGGILDITLKDFTSQLPGYYQVFVEFDTRDSMGANFINTCLEAMAEGLEEYASMYFPTNYPQPPVIMSILSNYTPECMVSCHVECPVESLDQISPGFPGTEFVSRFALAVNVASIDVYRATTHNKGIFNGIDAVVIATGNDFRAVEAAGHAYAARSGQYRGLSSVQVENGIFRFRMEIPLALGTVGGLTTLHPLATRSLELLGNPGAGKLMAIVAAVGLANHFSAIKALVTKGIQQGHMRMHLSNILTGMGVDEETRAAAFTWFKDKKVSHTAVKEFVRQMGTTKKV